MEYKHINTVFGNLIKFSNFHAMPSEAPDSSYKALELSDYLSDKDEPLLTVHNCYYKDERFALSLPGIKLLFQCSYDFEKDPADSKKFFVSAGIFNRRRQQFNSKYYDFILSHRNNLTMFEVSLEVHKEDLIEKEEKKFFYIPLFIPRGIMKVTEDEELIVMLTCYLLANITVFDDKPENASENVTPIYDFFYPVHDFYPMQFLHARDSTVPPLEQISRELIYAFTQLENSKYADKMKFHETFSVFDDATPDKFENIKRNLQQKIPIGTAIRYYVQIFLVLYKIYRVPKTEDDFTKLELLHRNLHGRFFLCIALCSAGGSLTISETKALTALILLLPQDPRFHFYDKLQQMKNDCLEKPLSVQEQMKWPEIAVRTLPREIDHFLNYTSKVGDPQSLLLELEDAPAMSHLYKTTGD